MASRTSLYAAQKAKGDKGEALLDQHFRKQGYAVIFASQEQQRNEKFDRILIRNHIKKYFEYKTDYRAHETGNFFFETYSNLERRIPGWAHTTQANILIYLIEAWRKYYWIPVVDFRKAMGGWNKFPYKEIPNQGYTTAGHVVPLLKLEEIATTIGQL